MTTSFRLPDLGEGVHEAEILAILVKVGQVVAEGDLILEIETDKAAVEIPSPYTGTVSEILVQIGDMAVVGDALITFTSDMVEDTVSPSAEGSKAAQRTQHKVTGQKPKVVPASPSTRRLARELGVELHQVTPTGSGGIVTRQDVEAYAKQGETAVPESTVEQETTSRTTASTRPPSPNGPGRTILPDFSKWGEIERQPFRSIRRATAKQMTSSWTQIPHVHCQDNVDITKLEAFRQKHKTEIKAAGGRLTMTLFAFMLKANIDPFIMFFHTVHLHSKQDVCKKPGQSFLHRLNQVGINLCK